MEINKYVFNKNKGEFKSNIKNISLTNKDSDSYMDEDGSIYIENKCVISKDELLNKMNLKGVHNVNNIMFVLEASNILGLDIEKSLEAIFEFKPLEHRMEFVAKINDVEYYNDSIATIPSSTINAIEAIGNIGTLIVGGKDRGINLTELFEYLNKSNIENIICLPKTGEFIYEYFNNKKDLDKNVILVENLEEAVRKAKKITPKGKVCIMSPKASSYGYFKNFEERGKLFKQYVLDSEVV